MVYKLIILTEGLCRVTEQMLGSLASEGDIADVVNMYTECFNPAGGDPSRLEEQHSNTTFRFGEPVEGADPGVEIESRLSPLDLAQNLGFVLGRPLLFNSHRHDVGLTPWDDPSGFQDWESLNTNPSFTAINLRWHQLAGVHAVLRRLFSKEPIHEPLGVLIADEVGLGKTLQCTAVVACLTEFVGRQNANPPRCLPPLLGM